MISLSKICNIEDFADIELREVIRDIFKHEMSRFGYQFPSGREYRKYWEIGIAVLAFRRAGLISPDSEILGVGAGNEATCFYLTRLVKRVFATDLYLSEGWEESANVSMLRNPREHWPFPWNPRRLVVQHMNALALQYEDASFDGVFSSSSIEHFGSDEEIGRALDEICRVLKPGGVAAISSEFQLSGDGRGWPGVRLFGRDDVERLFVGDRDWRLYEPFDFSVSAKTRSTIQSFADAVADQQSQVEQLGAHLTHHIEYKVYPHIVLDLDGQTWTSFQIALQKHR